MNQGAPMLVQGEVGQTGAASVAGHPAGFRYLARQPILDRRGRVCAYELLYRDGSSSMFRGDSELATQTMFDNSVLFGLQDLTHSLPAFVNCTAEALLGEQIRVLSPDVTVLEILEDVEPTNQVVEACGRLKAGNYRLALDDFVYRPALEPLIELADFIKVDYLNTTVGQRRWIFEKLKRFRGKLLAEKIETRPEYEEACNDGCTLFQGYYFCKPSFLVKRKVPANRCVHLRLLQLLQQDPLNLLETSEVIKSEPSVTYRLLRYANSPICGIRHEVTSIPSAILTLGDDLIRRIGTLAVTSELNAGSSPEILRMALVRARFCEGLPLGSALAATDQFMLGLFSMFPAMLQQPMEDALSGLTLRAPLREALMGGANEVRWPLDWLVVRERGEFDEAEAVAEASGWDSRFLADRFVQATSWADQLLA